MPSKTSTNLKGPPSVARDFLASTLFLQLKIPPERHVSPEKGEHRPPKEQQESWKFALGGGNR